MIGSTRSYIILIFLFLFYFFEINLTFGQSNYSSHNKKKCETPTLKELADSINCNFSNPEEKVESIYNWITSNISYNCWSYHFRFISNNKPEHVLKSKKGICAGYANLFKKLCDECNVQCVVIEGIVRTAIEPEKNVKIEKHAWNAVFVNDKWQLIDATWGSGYTNRSCSKFYKKQTNSFLYPDPELFKYSHFTEVDSLLFLNEEIHKSTFLKYPIVYQYFYDFQLKSFSPNIGFAETDAKCKNFIFKISDDSTSEISLLIIKKFSFHKSNFVEFSGAANYDFCQKGDYLINVYFKKKPILQYRMIVQKKKWFD